jgi:hypothetical protein
VPWFRRLVDGLSSPKYGFDPKKFHVSFVVDRVTQDWVLFPVLRFFPIIPPVLHTHFHLHVAVTRKTKGRRLGTLQGAMCFRKQKALARKKIIFYVPLDFITGNRIICAIPNYKFEVKRNVMDSGIGRFPKAINI